MNFLAHIYLSGDNEEILLGNFIGDYVKGKDHNNFGSFVQKGILLHRKIDSYTDSHPIVLEHKKLFYTKYHKYAGVVTDIIYDHYLAHEWPMFSDVAFDTYTENTYKWILANIDKMPEGMKKTVPFMIKHDWLHSYQSIEGIEAVLKGMSKNTTLPAEYEFAIYILKKHYNELKQGFLDYFPQLVKHVAL